MKKLPVRRWHDHVVCVDENLLAKIVLSIEIDREIEIQRQEEARSNVFKYNYYLPHHAVYCGDYFQYVHCFRLIQFVESA